MTTHPDAATAAHPTAAHPTATAADSTATAAHRAAQLHPQTRVVHAATGHAPGPGPLSVPIYQTSGFAFDDADSIATAMAAPDGDYVYTRRGNPTVRALETALAELEGGAAAIAAASGMGAISAVLLSLLQPGDHVLAQKCLYGGTFSVLTDLGRRFGIETTYLDAEDPAEIAAATRSNTRLLLLETIANPTTRVCDLPALLAAGRARGLVGVVDNSLASPVLCRPIEHGADIVVHSTTKYLAGHSDVIGGAAVFADPALHRTVWARAVELGATPDPFAAWLTIRGLQTLALRMRQHCSNAALLAERLAAHPAVTTVNWPGLQGHPDREVARRLLSDCGGMLSFELAGGREAGRRFIGAVRLARLALSIGGVETLVTHPASTSHRELTGEQLESAGIGPGTVRLAVGIEHPEDLWADLDQALRSVL
ncbi:aminotransferase class I/II-fold pyridoxal phosphate-dependent enzyme [Kitasatospora acidiphila]|uniref:homocysteine desulfhydrase n=1 Tax=Kitasatospora acidiphila TaxID=2567942 RepID=A0A540VYQ6_9ACTN|nr:aminotransferase class I/II-fold pyridoxal phosphate-dependent enzyme [Kitasatospora acidiphila]TQF01857.1 aminotransferase class I/II-fold pyridoxal phosphate-dependent enzyme [Kitasatospora acidiphila]